MKNDSRIIVTNLSEETAISVLKQVKKLTGGKVMLDRPDPPDLLEDEFGTVNQRLDDLRCVVEGDDVYYGEAETPAQVKKQIRDMQKHITQIEKAFNKVVDAVTLADEAAGALLKQKS